VFSADIIDMKKKYVFLGVLFVLVFVPFYLHAQSDEVFRQDGIASWYGREFEGRPTASGEIFDSSQLTAAHPSLPFGTRVTVTNLHNNKSVIVRINDRGPFVPARIIDVSRAAAEQLDMIVTGTAPVSVVSIDRIAVSVPAVGAQVAPQSVVTPVVTAPVTSSPPAAAPVFTSQPVVLQPQVAQTPVQNELLLKIIPEINILSDRNYRFQVGSFRNTRNAVEAFDKLKNTGLSPAYERFVSSDNIEYYRVVVAGVRGTDVQITIEKINAAGFREAIIREEN